MAYDEWFETAYKENLELLERVACSFMLKKLGWGTEIYACYAGRLGILTLGLLACYIPGTLWLMMLTGLTAAEALPLAVYPFLPGDAVKIIAAAVLAPKLREALRRAA